MEQEVFEGDAEDTPKGEYADCFRVGYSAHKFVLDFGQIVRVEVKEKPITPG